MGTAARRSLINSPDILFCPRPRTPVLSYVNYLLNHYLCLSFLLCLSGVCQSADKETSGGDPSTKLAEAKAEKESLVVQRDKAKQDLESWVEKYQEENGSIVSF